MKQEILARTIIETLIKKGLRDIEEDPDRSIRNLIDLGINFARGRFQKEFFETLQMMMQNEQSAYYTLVRQTVADIDHDRLMVFGMNLGFQGCTLGANLIRENENRWNFNIPWIYNVMFGEDGLPAETLDRLISEGKAMGTFVYLLYAAGRVTEESITLLKKHSDCAFFLLVKPEELLGDLLTFLTPVQNCMVLIQNDPGLLNEAADELRKHRFLYGIYEFYPENFEEIFCEEHLEQIMDTKAAFHVLMPETVFDFHENRVLQQRVTEFRNQQEYPFIIIDYNSDVQHIDRVISNDSCAVAFDAEGYIYTDLGKRHEESCNIQKHTLFDILNRVTRKEVQ